MSALPVNLLEALRRDRLLLWLTVALTALVWMPLFFSPFPPLHDLPDHAALASQIGRVLTGEPVSAAHYRIQWLPLPYTTAYAFMAALRPLVGGLFAAKLLIALIVVLQPLGLMRLAITLGRTPRLGLFAFAVVWDMTLMWGFVSFVLGLALLPFALSRGLEASSPRSALRVWPIAILVALSHPWVAALLVVALVAGRWVRAPSRAGWLTTAAVVAGPLLAVAPWVVMRLASGSASPVGGLEWHPLSLKLSRLFMSSLATIPSGAGRTAMLCVFVVMLILPVVLALTPRAAAPAFGTRVAALWYGGAWLGYLAFPMTTAWPLELWYIYPRYATPVLVGGILLARPALRGRWAWLLAGAAVCSAVVSLAMSRQAADFAQRAAPFQRIIDAVPAESRLLTLTLDDADPAVPMFPFNQFHAWVIAEKGGYDPYLFDHPSLPIRYRSEATLPHPPWNRMGEFRREQALAYDYLLVQGFQHDPVPIGDREIVPVLEAGRWRLYEVRPP